MSYILKVRLDLCVCLCLPYAEAACFSCSSVSSLSFPLSLPLFPSPGLVLLLVPRRACLLSSTHEKRGCCRTLQMRSKIHDPSPLSFSLSHDSHGGVKRGLTPPPPPFLLLQSVRLPIRPLFRHTVRQEMRWGDCVHSCVCAQVRYQMCSKWMLIWRLCINKIWVRLETHFSHSVCHFKIMDTFF